MGTYINTDIIIKIIVTLFACLAHDEGFFLFQLTLGKKNNIAACYVEKEIDHHEIYPNFMPTMM